MDIFILFADDLTMLIKEIDEHKHTVKVYNVFVKFANETYASRTKVMQIRTSNYRN
jgi:hypothetical protein